MNETDNDNDIEDDYPDNDIEDECACSRRFQCPHMTDTLGAIAEILARAGYQPAGAE